MGESRVLKALEKYRTKNNNTPIIVEGKKDVESLRKMNFSGEIITVNSGNSLVIFSENIAKAHREVILLTDFDKKGHELKSSLQKYLHGTGCSVDTSLWELLRRSVPIRTIEELPFAVQKIVETQY